MTIAVVLAGVYGMWRLHELGCIKQRAQKRSRTDRVALSLCGLFISKIHSQVMPWIYRVGELEHIVVFGDVIRRGVQPKQDAATSTGLLSPMYHQKKHLPEPAPVKNRQKNNLQKLSLQKKDSTNKRGRILKEMMITYILIVWSLFATGT